MINPVDNRDPSKLSPVVESVEYEGDLHGHLSMRMAQLLSLVRTCLVQTKFGSLPTELVADLAPMEPRHGGARNRGRWRVCRMMVKTTDGMELSNEHWLHGWHKPNFNGTTSYVWT